MFRIYSKAGDDATVQRIATVADISEATSVARRVVDRTVIRVWIEDLDTETIVRSWTNQRTSIPWQTLAADMDRFDADVEREALDNADDADADDGWDHDTQLRR